MTNMTTAEIKIAEADYARQWLKLAMWLNLGIRTSSQTSLTNAICFVDCSHLKGMMCKSSPPYSEHKTLYLSYFQTQWQHLESPKPISWHSQENSVIMPSWAYQKSSELGYICSTQHLGLRLKNHQTSNTHTHRFAQRSIASGLASGRCKSSVLGADRSSRLLVTYANRRWFIYLWKLWVGKPCLQLEFYLRLRSANGVSQRLQSLIEPDHTLLPSHWVCRHFGWCNFAQDMSRL